MERVLRFWVFVVFLAKWVHGFDYANVTKIEYLEGYMYKESDAVAQPLMIPLTLIQGADSKGAVCLDGTLPGYHIHRGSGSGANSWLVELEGGGWCDTISDCVSRKTTDLGSSKFMEKSVSFVGILSEKPEENPDFYNWKRVRVRYCDGASFAGEGYDKANDMYFRGQRIWSAAMDELMSKGMRNADQALLSGYSAGGVASILHCDEYRGLFSNRTKVKCLSDGGLFLDALDVSNGRTMRSIFHGVVTVQNAANNLPHYCTSHLDPTSCFFPQNIINGIKTPLFILNAAYDSWQVPHSLAPHSADPHGQWYNCTMNYAHCSASQIHFFQRFRRQMLNSVKDFSRSKQNGLFINSCFAHCQSIYQVTWFAGDSPVLHGKPVAIAVGDWYFDRRRTKLIDCPYPCDNTC